VAALAFCAGKNYILQSNLWAKTRAEHGTNGTDEKQNLLSKKEKNFNLIQSGKLLN
jgi:hypothetical protein